MSDLTIAALEVWEKQIAYGIMWTNFWGDTLRGIHIADTTQNMPEDGQKQARRAS